MILKNIGTWDIHSIDTGGTTDSTYNKVVNRVKRRRKDNVSVSVWGNIVERLKPVSLPSDDVLLAALTGTDNNTTGTDSTDNKQYQRYAERSRGGRHHAPITRRHAERCLRGIGRHNRRRNTQYTTGTQ
eukprot:Lankesteria_metandrocarpae@DN7239_c0_g1_i1.p1